MSSQDRTPGFEGPAYGGPHAAGKTNGNVSRMEIFFRWLLAPVWAVLFGRAESTRQGILLWTLAVAVEKQFPLVSFLEALADEAGGSWRWKVRGLAELISAGASIPDALEAMPGILPHDTLAMIRVGAQTGNMDGALREAARLARRRGEEPAVNILGTLAYLTIVTLSLGLVGTFIMIWIIPKYKKIFEGFDVKLPALTETMTQFCDAFGAYWYLAFPLFLLGILCSWSFMTFGLELMGLAPAWGRPHGLSSRLWPRFKTPHLLRCLSIAVEAGRPLPQALDILAEQHPDTSFRRTWPLSQTRLRAATNAGSCCGRPGCCSGASQHCSKRRSAWET